MKKLYIKPSTDVILLENIFTILACSGNSSSGIIHSEGTGEVIGTGDEDDEDEGIEGDSRGWTWDYEENY